MPQEKAERLMERRFRDIGIRFTDSRERADWTTSILAGEDLDLGIDVDLRWR